MNLISWIKERHADLGQIDILVEDQFCQEAVKVNTRGIEAQLEVLRKYFNDKEIKVLIEHELKILYSYGMKMQSKVIPDNNIKINFKKKKKRRKA